MSNIKEAAVVDTTTGSTIPVLPETVAAAPAVEVEAAKETESTLQSNDKKQAVDVAPVAAVDATGSTSTTAPQATTAAAEPAVAVSDVETKDKAAAAPEEKAVTGEASPKTPKKEKRGLFARLSGMFGSSPDKKDKTVKTNPTSTDKPASPSTTEIPAAGAEQPTIEESNAAAPATEAGAKAPEAEKELKKTEIPVSSTTQDVTRSDAPQTPVGADVTGQPKPELKSSNSAPKMHRRISARIGQYIDTRFGEKKEKPIAKQEKPEGIVASSDVAPEKEHKSAAAPPELAAPLAVEPLGEVVNTKPTPEVAVGPQTEVAK